MRDTSNLLDESAEDEENAGQHPGLDSGEPLRFGGVGRHRVEDVHQHQEQGDQQSHPPRDHVHRDQEGDPGDDHKEA
jgi:hypothetical protein